MLSIPRHTLPILALGACLALLAQPVRGQNPESSRFAFADTVLLRDTLGLRFDGLFPLADSLQLLPDTLRALSIRHRIPLARLVHLSDSLRVPVDSVGVVLLRERYNPLANVGARTNEFSYSSGYTITRRTTTWNNDTDYNLIRGAVFVRNVTSISITRTSEGGLTDLHKSRSLNTELGWRFSPDFSVGGRVSLQGTENFKPGSIYNNSQTTNQYDFSIRTRQQPTRNLRTTLNLFGGPFDEPNSTPIKKGFGAVLSGQVSYERGSWFSNDLRSQVTGRFGRARLEERPWLDTRDLTLDTRGDMSLFSISPVRFRLGYHYRKSELERPDTTTRKVDSTATLVDLVRNQPTSSLGADLTVRYQMTAERYLNLLVGLSSTENILAVTRDGVFTQDRSTSENRNVSLDGRAVFYGWALDGRFSGSIPISEQPRRSNLGGASVYYRERQEIHSRSVEVKASRNLTRRIVFNASGTASLNSTYQTALGSTNHTLDDYRQSYRMEGQVALSPKASTRLRLEVSRLLYVNLLASSSSSNREDRTYRGEWQWTYRLLRGLTVNQFNQISANYSFYSFVPQNDRLGLDYSTVTTLNAVLTPRLTMILTHNARTQPSGSYTRGPDGLDYFSTSDEGRDYTLRGSVSYQPTPGLSLRVEPGYTASDRDGTVDGVAHPVNRRRGLTLAGGATVDISIGSKGRLSGNLSRNFSSSSSSRFQAGVEVADPAYSDDFWVGTLQFSWSP